MWSCVGKKSKKQWIWLAIDQETGEIGARAKATARQLWESLPGTYRQCAVCSTDFWKSYESILPSKRHRQVAKSSGKTHHIERFNTPL